MTKWLIKLIMALGVLCLLMLTPTAKTNNQIALAQEGNDGIIHPYQGQAFYWTNGNGACHADGWGRYVGDIPSTCAVDFTAYGDGRDTNCGAPSMAPHSGKLTSLGSDSYGNTTAVLKGDRYWSFFLHGDFVPDGHLNQGDVYGYENTHGNSTGCHWHWSVFDTHTNQWVNPKDLVNGTIQVAIPDAEQEQKYITLPTRDLDISYIIGDLANTNLLEEEKAQTIEPAVVVNPNQDSSEYVLDNVPWNGTEYNVHGKTTLLIIIGVIALILIGKLLSQFPAR